MQIQYYGDFCFKITAKPGGRATDDVVLWTDPCDKRSGLRAPVGQADIVLLSHDIEERDRLSGLMKNEPIVLDAPGEYSARGFAIQGLASFRDEESGSKRGPNTVFTVNVEDMNLCFLGALGHPLTQDSLSHLEHIDILFLPVGNKDTLAAEHLEDTLRKVEPAIVIPMHYKMPGLTLDLNDTKPFCTAVGNCPKDALPKLIVKAKDLVEKKLEVVLLEKV